mmetsp:Transcript_15553/g.48139  ORF Transcript_15553/g.48139 Transcript_15553/m.48139 type:complete len:224 (-) Transcript_15553:123-794(-)
MAWGDEDDDDDALPARTETEVNARGMKTVVEWTKNAADQKIKTTKEIFVKTVETREAKAVAARVARLKGNKFGEAKTCTDDANVTIVAHNDERVTLEAEGGADDAQANAAKASMNEFAKKQMWRKLQQKYGVEGAAEGMPPPGDDAAGGLGGDARSGLSALGSGRTSYVPPSLRGQAGAGTPGSALSRMAAMPQYVVPRGRDPKRLRDAQRLRGAGMSRRRRG